MFFVLSHYRFISTKAEDIGQYKTWYILKDFFIPLKLGHLLKQFSYIGTKHRHNIYIKLAWVSLLVDSTPSFFSALQFSFSSHGVRLFA